MVDRPRIPRPGEPTGQDERAHHAREEALERMAKAASELAGGRRSQPRPRDREAGAMKAALARKHAAADDGTGRVLSEMDVMNLGDYDFEQVDGYSVPNRPFTPPGYQVVEGLDPVEMLEREQAAERAKKAAEKLGAGAPPMGPAPGGAAGGGPKQPKGGGGGGGGGQAQPPPMQPMMPPQAQPRPQTTAPPPMAPVMGDNDMMPTPPPPGQLDLNEFAPETRFGGEQGPGPLSQLQLQQNEINQRQNNIDQTLQQISMMMEQMQGVITTFQQQLQQEGQLTQQQQQQLQQVMQQVGMTMGPMMPAGQAPGEAPAGGAQGGPAPSPQGQPAAPPPGPQAGPPQAAPSQGAQPQGPPPGPPQAPPMPQPGGLSAPPGIQSDQERSMDANAPVHAPGGQSSLLEGGDSHMDGPDTELTQAARPQQQQPLEEQSELHPLKLKTILDQNLGPDWVNWEPETIAQTLEEQLGTPPDGETFEMVQAIQVLCRTHQFWMNWQAFEKIVLALCGISPSQGDKPAQPGEPGAQVDFNQIETLSPGQMVFATIQALRFSQMQQPEFGDEVLGFIAIQLQEAGLVWAPPPLDGAQHLLDQLHSDTAAPDPQLIEAKFRNMMDVPIEDAQLWPENDPVDNQVLRLMAIRDYVALKEAENGSQQQ